MIMCCKKIETGFPEDGKCAYRNFIKCFTLTIRSATSFQHTQSNAVSDECQTRPIGDIVFQTDGIPNY